MIVYCDESQNYNHVIHVSVICNEENYDYLKFICCKHSYVNDCIELKGNMLSGHGIIPVLSEVILERRLCHVHVSIIENSLLFALNMFKFIKNEHHNEKNKPKSHASKFNDKQMVWLAENVDTGNFNRLILNRNYEKIRETCRALAHKATRDGGRYLIDIAVDMYGIGASGDDVLAKNPIYKWERDDLHPRFQAIQSIAAICSKFGNRKKHPMRIIHDADSQYVQRFIELTKSGDLDEGGATDEVHTFSDAESHRYAGIQIADLVAWSYQRRFNPKDQGMNEFVDDLERGGLVKSHSINVKTMKEIIYLGNSARGDLYSSLNSAYDVHWN